MTSLTSVRRLFPKRLAPILVVCAVALSGCITEQQVQSLVKESNYQMLLATTPALGTGLATDPSSGGGADAEAAARISAFLAANPDDPVLSSALRLRQILIYLNQRAYALADAGFEQLDTSALHTARDRALVAAYPDLRWWAEFSHAKPFVFSGTQTDAAQRHIASLEQHAATPDLSGAPEVRDYFLEMQAWIGLKLGLATPNNPSFTADTIQKVVDAWTGAFTPAELALIGSGDFQQTQPFDLSTRRVIRARVLLGALAEARRPPPGMNLPPPPPLTFSQREINEYFATLSR